MKEVSVLVVRGINDLRETKGTRYQPWKTASHAFTT